METISLEPKQFSLNVGIEVAPPIADDVQGANNDNSELRNEHAGRRTDVPSARGTRADPGDHAQGGAVVKFTASDTIKARSRRSRICATPVSVSPRCVPTRE